MMKFLLIRVRVLIIVINIVTSTGQMCYPTQEEFVTACTEPPYSGVVDGGRCYFLSSANAAWDEGWSLCEALGATMAHVHSSKEMAVITSYLQGKPPTPPLIWTAMRRLSNSPIANWSMPLNYTYWYDNVTKPNQKLDVANTWSRVHANSDPFTAQTTYCFNVVVRTQQFCDYYCASSKPVLCQFTNLVQSFLYVSGICVAETSIQEFSASQAFECATKCSALVWCRSFNFVNGTTCQLFTWSLIDKPSVMRLVDKKICEHYTYV